MRFHRSDSCPRCGYPMSKFDSVRLAGGIPVHVECPGYGSPDLDDDLDEAAYL